VAVALVMAMLIAACGGSSGKGGSKTPTTPAITPTTSAGKPTPGGSVTFALEAESNGGYCLPEAQLAVSGIQVTRSIYDYLTEPNDKGQYVPDLADKISSNPDFTKWTIHLRSGIKFHDGTAFDAAVVKDNLDAYRGQFPKRKPLLFTFVFDYISNVKVVDPMTVEVDMKKPWSSFPASLYSYGRLGMMAEKQLNDGSNCIEDMIGTGPFEFKGGSNWVRNDHLTVVRNPNYWRKDQYGQQLPYLDQITFKPVTETTTLVNGLNSKQFDIAETDDDVAIAQLQPNVDSGSLSMLKTAQYPEVAYTMFNSSKPPFNNINARLAVASAINRDEYNRIANKGLLQLATGPFGPGTIGYVKDTNLPKYDVTAAKGYVAKYTAEAHQPLAFTFDTGSSPLALTDAQLIGKYLKTAGINMNIKQVDEATLINNAIYGTYQATAWRNHPGFDPDTQWVWWHCGVAPAEVGGATHVGTDDAAHGTGNNCDNPVNFGRFNDAVINQNFEKARGTDNVATRTAAYEAINKEFAKQVWNGWGYWSLWTMPTQTDVQGILGPNLPTATSPDASATGDTPFTGLSSGDDVSGLWLKK
jgi:peptide/nickel transport system substrate-binding protein